MTNSQNGWPVVTASHMDTSPIAGVKFPNGFLEGDVSTVFHWFFQEFHHTVEPLRSGECWGYDHKLISGSDVWSNHASGTAGDVNASHHGQGKHGTFSAVKVSAIRILLRKVNHVIYWGGDFSNVDEMHFEARGTMAAMHATAVSLRAQGGVPLRTHDYVSLKDNSIAALFLGENDADFAGAHMIARAQDLMGITVDGDYGPATKAAVAKLPTEGSGSSIGLAQWVALLGLRGKL